MDAYIYRGALYCEECVEENWIVTLRPEGTASGAFSGGSDTMPQGPYPDGGGEADGPQHCSCGVFLENPLTGDGIEYVRASLDAFDASGIEDRRGPHDSWRTFYADALAS